MNIFSPQPVREFNDASQQRIDHVKELFSNNNLISPLHVHVLGACGTGMGAIVCLLKQLGFYVSGSDKAFYPPMGDFIREYADVLYEKYSASNLLTRPALVVVGNALSRGNEELEKVLEDNIPFCSMSELLSALLIRGHQENPVSIVVSGTHGKTTTTALLAHILTVLDRQPAYFFGGVPTGDTLNLPIKPFDLNTPRELRVSVIEGDEYDSAFFAKYSKFHCYRPDILVVTNIEFDHGDIFESIVDIENEFLKLFEKMPKAGFIVACYDACGARRVVDQFKAKNPNGPNVIWYGEDESCDIRILSTRLVEGRSSTDFQQSLNINVRGREINIATKLTGTHNALNIAAAVSVLDILKLDLSQVSSAINSYSHVMRRQQVHIKRDDLVLIEDFAHHPTEVYYTLSGIKQAYPQRRLVAIFEPRSNTSRRAFFKDDYIRALCVADLIIIKEVDSGNAGYSGVSQDKELLDVSKLVTELKNRGKQAFSFLEIEMIFDKTKSLFEAGDVIMVMSNGDFGGIIKKYIDWGNEVNLLPTSNIFMNNAG